MQVNTAHDSGLTRLCFSVDGKKLYTGGDDSFIRVWDTSKDASEEPKQIRDAEEAITSIDCSAKVWAVASADSYVRQYSSVDDSMEGNITKSNVLAVRCVAFSPNGKKVVVTSEESTVKIVDVENPLQVILLNEHTKGVRAATWNPKGNILTTSGQDGRIIAWTELEESSPKSHTITGIIASVDSEAPEFMYDVAAVWHPNGRYFVVPSVGHEVVRVLNDSWSKNEAFNNSGEHNSAVTAVAFSPNGKYLASAGADGQVFIWDTLNSNLLFKQQGSSKVAVTAIRFSPTENALAWTALDGTLSRWGKPIPPSHSSPVGYDTAVPSKAKVNVSSDEFNKMFEDLGDNDDGMDIGEADGREKDLDPDVDDAGNGMEEYGDDWIIDDEDGGPGYRDDKAPEERRRGGLREMVNVTKAQLAFQPGSTSLRNRKQYLAFNMIGVIEVTDQETHHIVNVEFHDKFLRRGYHFTDHFKYSLASLGPRGALYAARSDPSTKSPAQIHYRPYDTWASSAEWSIVLPIGEEPIAVCAGGAAYKKSRSSDEDDESTAGPNDEGGSGHAVVATSRGFVRFWMGTGVQSYVWHLGGEVVSLAAGDQWVFVVHRDGGTSLDGCQNLRYTIISLGTFDIINSGPVPLAKNVTLSWIGITSEGAPTMYDSAGMLSVLDRFRRPTQGRWVPALDTMTLARREGKDESYWPVGLSSKEFMCVILKGQQKEPGFPRPIISEIEVQLPLLGMDNLEGQGEEKVLRGSIQVGIERDALPSSEDTSPSIHALQLSIDKQLISLVQAACKADKLERALDYTSMLNHVASFDLARKVAEFYHLPGLSEKMGALKQLREEREMDEENEDDVDPRRGWGRVMEPISRPYVNDFSADGRRANGRNGYVEDFPPPPVAPKRSLAAAQPFRMSTRADLSLPSSPVDPGSSLYTAVESGSLSTEREASGSGSGSFSSKRKRNEDDDALLASPKKKTSTRPVAVGTSIPQPIKNANPFARRKNAQATQPPGSAGPTSSNPFVRNGLAKSESLAKSKSFFQKVDAAEDDIAARPKGRNNGVKKTVEKQTTLFGLPTKASTSSSKKGKAREVDEEEVSTPMETETAEVDSPRPLSPGANGGDVEETLHDEPGRSTSPDWDLGADDDEGGGVEETQMDESS